MMDSKAQNWANLSFFTDKYEMIRCQMIGAVRQKLDLIGRTRARNKNSPVN